MSVEIFAQHYFAAHPADPLTYSMNTRMFTIGAENIALSDKFQHSSDLREPTTEQEAQASMDSSPLLIQLDEWLFMMPLLRNWLRDSSSSVLHQVNETVVETMVDAYVQLGGSQSVAKFRGNSARDFAFGVSADGHPVFQVYGDCACLCVTADGHAFTANAWEKGYGQFDFHNVDHIYEQVALLAGAGALAAMVEGN